MSTAMHYSSVNDVTTEVNNKRAQIKYRRRHPHSYITAELGRAVVKVTLQVNGNSQFWVVCRLPLKKLLGQ